MNENQELPQIRDQTENNSANAGNQDNSYSQSGNLGFGSMRCRDITEPKIAGVIVENGGTFNNNLFPISQQPLQPFTQELKLLVISEEHKYEGNLVIFQLHFWEDETKINPSQVLVKLTITFGEAKEVFPVKRLWVSPKNVNVRFGISRGELYLTFDKSSMPLPKRGRLINSDYWKADQSGKDKSPKWVFKPWEGQQILEGQLENGNLGIVNLQNSDYIKATFKVDINRRDIDVTFLDDANENKKTKETKKAAFLKFIKPKLEEYLSKIELQYDSAINK